MSIATLPTLVTLGTPAAVQTLYAFSPDLGPMDWVLPLVLWVYGLLFWINSEGVHLFKAKKWEWTDEAIEEQQRRRVRHAVDGDQKCRVVKGYAEVASEHRQHGVHRAECQ